MADDHTVVIAVIGVLGLVAIAGLLAFAMMRSGTGGGSIAVLDSNGNLLYTVSDSQTQIRRIGSVNFVPEN